MKYLTEKDMARDWAFGTEVCQMRQVFRRMMDKDPEAFATCVREYMEYGEERFPKIESTGGNLATPRHSLAALLAEYQIAQSRGITQNEFLESEGEKGIKSADQYTVTSWQSESAVRGKLNNARQLYKSDPGFKAQVEFYRDAFEAIGGSRG